MKTTNVGPDLYSFLESREIGKQNVREHFPLKLINVTPQEEGKCSRTSRGTRAG